jgi:hypothetical protein
MNAGCHGCDRRWTGALEAHCSRCHESFGSPRGFDMHRRGSAGDRRCADPSTLQRKDGHAPLVAVERKSGVVWVEWSRREHPFAQRVPSAERLSPAPEGEGTAVHDLGVSALSRIALGGAS